MNEHRTQQRDAARGVKAAVGGRIRTRREAAGYTQRAFAKRVHITTATMQTVESGKHSMPLILLAAIADELDVPLGSLLDGDA